MSRYRDEEEKDYEEVAQFIVELSWGADHYYDQQQRQPGLDYAKIVIEGVATSTQAIEKAKELLASVRVDEPRKTEAELKTFKRLIPKRVGNGTTIDVG